MVKFLELYLTLLSNVTKVLCYFSPSEILGDAKNAAASAANLPFYVGRR